MQVSDIKNGDILYIKWGCKPGVKSKCVSFSIGPGQHLYGSIYPYNFTSIEGDSNETQWYQTIERVYEDWGQLFMKSFPTSHSGIEQYFIEHINPCHQCKYRLGRAVGCCPGKFEEIEKDE